MKQILTKSTIITGLFLMLFFAINQSTAQNGDGERAEGSNREQWRQRFNPEMMRQRINERMKEMLVVDEEEWTVIQPRLENVFNLNRQLQGRRFNMFGRGGRRGGQEQSQENPQEQSGIEKALSELSTLLEQEKPGADQINAMLVELRSARQQVRQELIVAQQQLRELLTLQQEAQLVMMGTLE